MLLMLIPHKYQHLGNAYDPLPPLYGINHLYRFCAYSFNIGPEDVLVDLQTYRQTFHINYLPTKWIQKQILYV